jgi:hypothetical protein
VRVLKPVFVEQLEARKAQALELLSWFALADDLLQGMPITSRTPGIIAGRHVDHRDLQEAAVKLRAEINVAYGFELGE